MLITQTRVFDVPTAIGTIVTLREINSYNRMMYFENLGANTLAVQVQQSTDGGNTWALIDTAFNIGPKGGGADIITKQITSGNILRVQASGGGDDRDLYFGFTRMMADGDSPTWVPPVM